MCVLCVLCVCCVCVVCVLCVCVLKAFSKVIHEWIRLYYHSLKSSCTLSHQGPGTRSVKAGNHNRISTLQDKAISTFREAPFHTPLLQLYLPPFKSSIKCTLNFRFQWFKTKQPIPIAFGGIFFPGPLLERYTTWFAPLEKLYICP